MEDRRIGVELINGNVSGFFAYKKVGDLIRDIIFVLALFGFGGITIGTRQSLSEMTARVESCQKEQASLAEKLADSKVRIATLEATLVVGSQTMSIPLRPQIRRPLQQAQPQTCGTVPLRSCTNQ